MNDDAHSLTGGYYDSRWEKARDIYRNTIRADFHHASLASVVSGSAHITDTAAQERTCCDSDEPEATCRGIDSASFKSHMIEFKSRFQFFVSFLYSN